MNDVTFKPISQSHDDSTGMTTHRHAMLEGDNQIGTLDVVVGKNNKFGGFKLKGGKMKHYRPALNYLREAHPELMHKALRAKPPAAPAVPSAPAAPAVPALPGMGSQAKTPAAPVSPSDLDHDRRRVKSAVKTLLGKKESIHNPDGKVNNLKKSFASPEARKQYKNLLGTMQDLTGHVVKRASMPSMSSFHDHAAYMLVNAQEQLSNARKHMLQDKLSAVDHLRGLFSREPLHMKHLRTADAFLTAARNFTIKGDQAMHGRGALPDGSPFLTETPKAFSASASPAVFRSFLKVKNDTSGFANTLKVTAQKAQADAEEKARMKAAKAAPVPAAPVRQRAPRPNDKAT